MAILYRRGPSVPMIADWFDLREGTIYRCFVRLESELLHDAIRARPRSVRPPKIGTDQRETFEEMLRDLPSAHGYNASSWTPELARGVLREAIGVEYARWYLRRILREADAARGRSE